MIRYARQMLVRRYGTSYACRLIISIIIRLRPSVFSRCYLFSLSDPPLCCHCRRPKGMDSTQLQRDTAPLCLLAVAEPEICVNACVMNMLFSCLPGHASNCLPAVTNAWSIQKMTHAAWYRNLIVNDPSDSSHTTKKGWKGRLHSSPCHRGYDAIIAISERGLFKIYDVC